MKENMEHKSVMLNEAVDAMNIYADGIYIDATYGCGGHSREILCKLGSQGRLIVIDKDPRAIQHATAWAADDPRVTVIHGSFSEIYSYCQNLDILGKINGVLFDLGVSSPQLDQAERGFSFMQQGPLDMRMDPTSGISAADWLQTAKAEDIADVIYTFGEERYSRRIAAAIVRQREIEPIITTKQLAELVAKSVPRRDKNKHPATRTFQGIRIFINHELSDLQKALAKITEVLAPQGRLVSISFHSLEDRIVKQFIAKQVRGNELPARLPIPNEQLKPNMRKLARNKPSEIEISDNVRARSAILRVAENIGTV